MATNIPPVPTTPDVATLTRMRDLLYLSHTGGTGLKGSTYTPQYDKLNGVELGVLAQYGQADPQLATQLQDFINQINANWTALTPDEDRFDHKGEASHSLQQESHPGGPWRRALGAAVEYGVPALAGKAAKGMAIGAATALGPLGAAIAGGAAAGLVTGLATAGIKTSKINAETGEGLAGFVQRELVEVRKMREERTKKGNGFRKMFGHIQNAFRTVTKGTSTRQVNMATGLDSRQQELVQLLGMEPGAFFALSPAERVQRLETIHQQMPERFHDLLKNLLIQSKVSFFAEYNDLQMTQNLAGLIVLMSFILTNKGVVNELQDSYREADAAVTQIVNSLKARYIAAHGFERALTGAVTAGLASAAGDLMHDVFNNQPVDNEAVAQVSTSEEEAWRNLELARNDLAAKLDGVGGGTGGSTLSGGGFEIFDANGQYSAETLRHFAEQGGADYIRAAGTDFAGRVARLEILDDIDHLAQTPEAESLISQVMESSGLSREEVYRVLVYHTPYHLNADGVADPMAYLRELASGSEYIPRMDHIQVAEEWDTLLRTVINDGDNAATILTGSSEAQDIVDATYRFDQAAYEYGQVVEEIRNTMTATPGLSVPLDMEMVAIGGVTLIGVMLEDLEEKQVVYGKTDTGYVSPTAFARRPKPVPQPEPLPNPEPEDEPIINATVVNIPVSAEEFKQELEQLISELEPEQNINLANVLPFTKRAVRGKQNIFDAGWSYNNAPNRIRLHRVLYAAFGLDYAKMNLQEENFTDDVINDKLVGYNQNDALKFAAEMLMIRQVGLDVEVLTDANAGIVFREADLSSQIITLLPDGTFEVLLSSENGRVSVLKCAPGPFSSNEEYTFDEYQQLLRDKGARLIKVKSPQAANLNRVWFEDVEIKQKAKAKSEQFISDLRGIYDTDNAKQLRRDINAQSGVPNRTDAWWSSTEMRDVLGELGLPAMFFARNNHFAMVVKDPELINGELFVTIVDPMGYHTAGQYFYDLKIDWLSDNDKAAAIEAIQANNFARLRDVVFGVNVGFGGTTPPDAAYNFLPNVKPEDLAKMKVFFDQPLQTNGEDCGPMIVFAAAALYLMDTSNSNKARRDLNEKIFNKIGTDMLFADDLFAEYPKQIRTYFAVGNSLDTEPIVNPDEKDDELDEIAIPDGYKDIIKRVLRDFPKFKIETVSVGGNRSSFPNKFNATGAFEQGGTAAEPFHWIPVEAVGTTGAYLVLFNQQVYFVDTNMQGLPGKYNYILDRKRGFMAWPISAEPVENIFRLGANGKIERLVADRNAQQFNEMQLREQARDKFTNQFVSLIQSQNIILGVDNKDYEFDPNKIERGGTDPEYWFISNDNRQAFLVLVQDRFYVMEHTGGVLLYAGTIKEVRQNEFGDFTTERVQFSLVNPLRIGGQSFRLEINDGDPEFRPVLEKFNRLDLSEIREYSKIDKGYGYIKLGNTVARIDRNASSSRFVPVTYTFEYNGKNYTIEDRMWGDGTVINDKKFDFITIDGQKHLLFTEYQELNLLPLSQEVVENVVGKEIKYYEEPNFNTLIWAYQSNSGNVINISQYPTEEHNFIWKIEVGDQQLKFVVINGDLYVHDIKGVEGWKKNDGNVYKFAAPNEKIKIEIDSDRNMVVSNDDSALFTESFRTPHSPQTIQTFKLPYQQYDNNWPRIDVNGEIVRPTSDSFVGYHEFDQYNLRAAIYEIDQQYYVMLFGSGWEMPVVISNGKIYLSNGQSGESVELNKGVLPYYSLPLRLSLDADGLVVEGDSSLNVENSLFELLDYRDEEQVVILENDARLQISFKDQELPGYPGIKSLVVQYDEATSSWNLQDESGNSLPFTGFGQAYKSNYMLITLLEDGFVSVQQIDGEGRLAIAANMIDMKASSRPAALGLTPSADINETIILEPEVDDDDEEGQRRLKDRQYNNIFRKVKDIQNKLARGFDFSTNTIEIEGSSFSREKLEKQQSPFEFYTILSDDNTRRLVIIPQENRELRIFILSIVRTQEIAQEAGVTELREVSAQALNRIMINNSLYKMRVGDELQPNFELGSFTSEDINEVVISTFSTERKYAAFGDSGVKLELKQREMGDEREYFFMVGGKEYQINALNQINGNDIGTLNVAGREYAVYAVDFSEGKVLRIIPLQRVAKAEHYFEGIRAEASGLDPEKVGDLKVNRILGTENNWVWEIEAAGEKRLFTMMENDVGERTLRILRNNAWEELGRKDDEIKLSNGKKLKLKVTPQNIGLYLDNQQLLRSYTPGFENLVYYFKGNEYLNRLPEIKAGEKKYHLPATSDQKLLAFREFPSNNLSIALYEAIDSATGEVSPDVKYAVLFGKGWRAGVLVQKDGFYEPYWFKRDKTAYHQYNLNQGSIFFRQGLPINLAVENGVLKIRASDDSEYRTTISNQDKQVVWFVNKDIVQVHDENNKVIFEAKYKQQDNSSTSTWEIINSEVATVNDAGALRVRCGARDLILMPDGYVDSGAYADNPLFRVGDLGAPNFAAGEEITIDLNFETQVGGMQGGVDVEPVVSSGDGKNLKALLDKDPGIKVIDVIKDLRALSAFHLFVGRGMSLEEMVNEILAQYIDSIDLSHKPAEMSDQEYVAIAVYKAAKTRGVELLEFSAKPEQEQRIKGYLEYISSTIRNIMITVPAEMSKRFPTEHAMVSEYLSYSEGDGTPEHVIARFLVAMSYLSDEVKIAFANAIEPVGIYLQELWELENGDSDDPTMVRYQIYQRMFDALGVKIGEEYVGQAGEELKINGIMYDILEQGVSIARLSISGKRADGTAFSGFESMSTVIRMIIDNKYSPK